MSDEVDEWVCLDCYNRWQPRNPPEGKAQCSNSDCRGRFTFPYPIVENHVSNVRSLIDEQLPPVGEVGKLPTPLETLPDLLETGQSMIQQTDRPRAAKGIDLLEAIQEIVREWQGEDAEPLTRPIDRLHNRQGESES